MLSSATLPHSGDLINFHFQVALALTREQAKHFPFTTQIRYLYNYLSLWWCQYVIYLLHFPLLAHGARPLVFMRNSTFLLMIYFTRCTFSLIPQLTRS